MVTTWTLKTGQDATFDIVSGESVVARGVSAIDARFIVAAREAYSLMVESQDVPPPPPPPPPPTGVVVPQHLSHVRVRLAAYDGSSYDAASNALLADVVDMVNGSGTAAHIAAHGSAYITTYTNVSNIYGNLLQDAIDYADANALNREDLFYHISQTYGPGTQAGGSTVPVKRFFGVYQSTTNWTVLSYTVGSTAVPLGTSAIPLHLGYNEKFREVNIVIAAANGTGTATWEYCSAVDGSHLPTTWTALTLIADGTSAFTVTGQVTFEPPADWVPCKIQGSSRFYYVRCSRTGTEPTADTILGYDWAYNVSGNTWTQKPFDYAADVGNKGYLTAAEYAGRQSGFDAQFAYQGRAFSVYGQNRFAVNQNSPNAVAWAIQWIAKVLAANPLAPGIFLDNNGGHYFFLLIEADATVESVTTATYTTHSAALTAALVAAYPDVMFESNVAGSTTAEITTMGAASRFLWYEGIMRPQRHYATQFTDLAATVAAVLALSPDVHLSLDILNTDAAGNTVNLPSDARFSIAMLAYYYLMAHPTKTFLGIVGPNATPPWDNNWVEAIKRDIGQPTGAFSVFVTNGSDPANTAYKFNIYQRVYTNALILWKSVSRIPSSTVSVSNGDETLTTHSLGGTYYPLSSTNTVGAGVTTIDLRNGEGAILMTSP